jgi:hypothetical protein
MELELQGSIKAIYDIYRDDDDDDGVLMLCY